jgi:hypothetical protein
MLNRVKGAGKRWRRLPTSHKRYIAMCATLTSFGCIGVAHGDVLQIPGRVTLKKDRIEFVAVAADIRPDTFVGVRYLRDKLVRFSLSLV